MKNKFNKGIEVNFDDLFDSIELSLPTLTFLFSFPMPVPPTLNREKVIEVLPFLMLTFQRDDSKAFEKNISGLLKIYI